MYVGLGCPRTRGEAAGITGDCPAQVATHLPPETAVLLTLLRWNFRGHSSGQWASPDPAGQTSGTHREGLASMDAEACAQHSSAVFLPTLSPFAVTPSELDRTGNKVTELARKAPRVTLCEGSTPDPGPWLFEASSHLRPSSWFLGRHCRTPIPAPDTILNRQVECWCPEPRPSCLG